ncbi:MAG: 50S ribosomal protein L11 methyltransferase [Methanosarcinaceae archaeon]
MNYSIKIQIPLNEDIREGVTNRLFELGTTGCQDEANSIIAYFDSKIDCEMLVSKIEKYLINLSELGFRVESYKINIKKIENEDWSESWKKNYKPVHIGNKFVVKPAWINYKPSSEKRIIEIDPKMAFGTGTHETTQMMIRLMEFYVKGAERVLDIGTGTGILSIAAKYLGAGKIIAFDVDPVTADCIRENFTKNGVEQTVIPFIGTIDCLKSIQFDLILANINKMIILQIFNKMEKLLKKTGVIILSGILDSQTHEIIAAAGNWGFHKERTIKQGEWEAIALRYDL